MHRSPLVFRTVSLSFFAVLALGSPSCTCGLPQRTVTVPGDVAVAAGLSPVDYVVWGSEATESATVSTDGAFFTTQSGWHTGFVFAAPRAGSPSVTRLAPSTGVYLSPSLGDSRVVLSAGAYGLATSGSMQVDATSTVLSLLLMHPTVAHPSLDVSVPQTKWMLDRLRTGWPCLTEGAQAYDQALASGADPSLSPVLLAALTTCLNEVGENLPEFAPPVPTAAQLDAVKQGLGDPLSVQVKSSDVVVSKLTVKSVTETGARVLPATEGGTAVDYYFEVKRLTAAASEDGVASLVFTNLDPYSPHASEATLASGFIPASPYWAYFDVVGLIMKSMTKLFAEKVTLAPDATVELPPGTLDEVRFFSGASSNETLLYPGQVSTAFQHNLIMGAIEALSVIPGVDKVLSSDAGQKTLRSAILEAAKRGEALFAISAGRTPNAHDVWDAMYGVLKKAVDTFAKETFTATTGKWFYERAATYIAAGGMEIVKTAVSLPGRIAKGACVTHRIGRMVQPHSSLEYYIVSVQGPAAVAVVDAGSSSAAPVVTQFIGPAQPAAFVQGTAPGSFSVTVTGGKPPYEYTWLGSNAPQPLLQGTQHQQISVTPSQLRSAGTCNGVKCYCLWVTVTDDGGNGRDAHWKDPVGAPHNQFAYCIDVNGVVLTEPAKFP
jgi:hypothetical protein